LRYGLPFENKELREIQSNLENIKSDLRLRRIPFAKSDVSTLKRLTSQYSSSILQAMPENHKSAAQSSFKRLLDKAVPLEKSLASESETGSGSIQERSFLDAYSHPMIQLDPFKVMLVISHSENTFDKKKMREVVSPFVKETGFKLNNFIKKAEIRNFYADA
jgi:peptidylprolyl isomerase